MQNNNKQNFIQNLFGKMFSSGVVHADPRPEPTHKEIYTEKYNQKFSPELRKMIDAMAYQESVNGQKRINPKDQEDGTHSYGLLHMGQGAVDDFNKRATTTYDYWGGPQKAADLQGPESDYLQKYMQASRIDRDMKVNKRDLYSATRYIQNFGDPNYATTTMNKYNKQFPTSP